MYNPQEIFDNNFIKLDEKWTQLSNLKELDVAEFEKLYQETLGLSLDFRMQFTDNLLKTKFLQTMSSVKLFNHEMDRLENLCKVEKWSSSMASALLSGKLIASSSKLIAPHMKKFLLEEDDVIQARIEALLMLFENTSTDESSQMIINALDTYKKNLICETELQNKVSCRTVEVLVKALLTIHCHRKEYDHLNSMIKFLPHHRKVQILVNEIKTESNPQLSVKSEKCQLFVCLAIVQDLFQSEFLKPIEEQIITNYNLYANLIIDLAVQKQFISSQLENVFLSANSMNVISDYYYMIANMLMFKMPNQHKNLVVKLISVGISHDLSNLEQIKYTKDNYNLKWTNEDFEAVHRKMFVALAFLGVFIKDYSLRRLCIKAASVCEPSSTYCSEILEFLPECDTSETEIEPVKNVVFDHLREQLETFQSGVKMKVNLANTWQKASLLCYEKLDFHNRRMLLSDDLKPLEYPGIERYLKRAKVDDAQETKPIEEKPLNAATILNESDSFAITISSRFKNLNNPFNVENNLKPPNPLEVSAVIANILSKSSDFETGERGMVLMNLSPEISLSALKDYNIRWFWINKEQQKLNKPNLFFDFNLEETDPSCRDVSSMYQSGIVRVIDLCRMGCNIFDIENVMLYALIEKKMLYMQQEFVQLNKNPIYVEEQISAHAAFDYLTSKSQPEFGRLSKLVNAAYTSASMLEFCIENYVFDLAPGKNYYKKKQLDSSMKEESEIFTGEDQLDLTAEEQMELPKTKTPKDTKNSQRLLSSKIIPTKIPSSRREAKARQKKVTQPKPARENVVVAVDDTFHVSDEILGVLYLIQNGFSFAVGEKVNLDLEKLTDETSPHKIRLTYDCTSVMRVKIQKRRNGLTCPSSSHEIHLPARVHGVITAVIDITDKIEYDENNDNPRVKSTSEIKLNGMIAFDHATINVKDMDLMCKVNGIVSKFRFSMRHGSRGAHFQAKTKTANDVDKEQKNEPEENGNISINDLNNSLTVDTPPSVSLSQTPPEETKIVANVNNLLIETNQNAFSSNITSESFQASTFQNNDLHHAPVQFVNPIIQNFEQTNKNNEYYTERQTASPLLLANPTPFNDTSNPYEAIDTREGAAAATLISMSSSQYHEVSDISQTEPLSLVTIAQKVLQHPPICSSPDPVVNNHIEFPLKQNLKRINEKVQILKIENIESVDPIEVNFVTMNFNGCTDRQVSMNDCANYSLSYNPVLVKSMQINGEDNINEPLRMIRTSVDYDREILPCPLVFKPKQKSGSKESNQEQTPPTSPLQQHPNETIAMNKTNSYNNVIVFKKEFMDSSVDRILNNTPPDDVIDLTKEGEVSRRLFGPARMKPSMALKKPRPIIRPSVIEFVHCKDLMGSENHEIQMPTKGVEISSKELNEAYSRVLKKLEMKNMSQSNGFKRLRMTPEDADECGQQSCRESEVRLVNVMQYIDKSILKKNMTVNAGLTKVNLPPNREAYSSLRKDYQISSADLEEPYEDPLDYVTDARQSTFHIIYQNFVSYLFDDQSGDGISNTLLNANNQCNEKISSKPNLLKNNINIIANVNKNELRMSNLFYVDNNDNDKILKKFGDVDLSKKLYSDKNCFNFTKNLKNFKKFVRWAPKMNNDSKTDKFCDKIDDKKPTDDDNLLLQMSHEVLKSIPGLNSFEFFQFPSTPRRMIHVKVIHIFKDIKNGISSTSCDTSDTDAEQHSETNNIQIEAFNGEAAHASSTHVQKIGQTSINREGDSKTIQTSFGSIIKNTYPPATLSSRSGNGSELVKTIEKEQQKFTKLKNEDVQLKKILSQEITKTSSNIKIVACSSNATQIDPQKINRNQTLINMLTQQVMMPTNSNRHFIITSRAEVMKTENNITTVTSALPSHQNVVKKVVTNQGQSQLVQILNSPPSSFTMKTMNSSIASQVKPPNQLVTVTAPGTNNSNNFKAELPPAAKQQGIVQFICKTDGKIIHLTPICSNSAGGSSKKITYKVDTSGAKGPTILHHANQQIIINNPLKKSDNQNILTIIQKQDDGDKKNKGPMLSVSQTTSTPTSPISTRSIYEETYAKFIQTSSSGKPTDMGLLTISSSPINSPITSSTQSSIIQKIGKTVIQSSNQVLPKFNQAFGKTIFATNSSLNEQMRSKIVGTKEIMTTRHMTVSFPDTKPVTKVTRTVSEIKSTDAGTLLSLIENESAEKPLPTLQSALQSSLLYARPIGNGKLLASNSNNVLLNALRNNNQTSNVRIITSISDNANRSSGGIMAPMRISVPIQIPKLINTSVRSQTPGTYRQQIVIATAPSRIQQTTVNSQPNTSKLESLLMTSQPTVVKQEVEIEQQQMKMEIKQKKNVDHSTLEQLREFDMVLEQVLERSSSEMTTTSMSSPPTPESVSNLSPKKQVTVESKIKNEMKLNAVTITSISPSVSPSPKSVNSNANTVMKVAPKLQEDEHTAQRILDILANYKEQVRNSPDLNNKPAPRRRANPPTNPPAAKRKKISASGSMGSMKTSSKFGSTSDMMTDTMGSEEDSSCGMGSGVASTGSMNNSPQPQDIDDQTDVSMDNNFYMEDSKRETALSPQSSSSSVATSPSHNKFPLSRRLVLTETKTSSGSEMSPSPSKNIVITNTSTASSGSLGTSIERFAGHGSTAAVLMPGNYLLPMNVLKGGQQLAILSSNNGQKIIAVPTNQLVSNSSGASIILQRYLNQANEAGNKTVLSTNDASQNAFKSIRLQQNQTVSYMSNKNNNSTQSGNTLYIRPIQNMSTQNFGDTKTIISNHQTIIKQEDDATRDSQNSKFVSDKNLITEIIQQQQQLSHTHQHPQQNFMIKFNEHQPSDPRSSSSIMFVSNSNSVTSNFADSKQASNETPKIKIEEIDYDDYMKEDAIDLLNESDSMAKSPMLNTKIEVDENTNSNHESNSLIYDNSGVKMENEQEQKFQHFPIILNSCHGKSLGVSHVSTSANIKGFLIDPTNKIVMYSDRKPAAVEKEFYNQKSFSEECADLGVDEPIASDLFPEADLLFESDSPKFDQINSHDGTMHIKKELENGQVLLEMNYNHNMETESWLNFDTEEELVDDSQIVNGGGNDGVGHSGDLKAFF